MEIELKNGEKIFLEVSSLLLEYLEDYDGGIEQLTKDANTSINEKGYTTSMLITNYLLYSIIASNYNKEIGYREAIKLVKLEDIPKIINFLVESIPNISNQNKVSIEKVNKKHRF